MNFDTLQNLANRLRYKVIEISHSARTPHLGSSLSCIDILVAAYWKFLRVDPHSPASLNRDRFILSKGHAALAHYVTLAERGFFGKELLDSFARPKGCLPEQPAPGCAPGVELATGSLGHGLPVGGGLALAAKIRRMDYYVLVLMSDGECNEGSVWETAMFAPAKKLSNLIVVIDYNKWQATDRSCEVMALDPLTSKWEAFGWRTLEVDGHDFQELTQALFTAREASTQPTAIVAHTVKGKGVSFMEDDNNWHYRIPTMDEVQMARRELLSENEVTDL